MSASVKIESFVLSEIFPLGHSGFVGARFTSKRFLHRNDGLCEPNGQSGFKGYSEIGLAKSIGMVCARIRFVAQSNRSQTKNF